MRPCFAVPHGVSVALPAPAVFRYTGPACPDRHLECAAILGADVSGAKSGDGEHAGALLAEALVRLMSRVGLPLGLAPRRRGSLLYLFIIY